MIFLPFKLIKEHYNVYIFKSEVIKEKYTEDNMEADLSEWLDTAGLAVKLKNSVYMLDREARMKGSGEEAGKISAR